LHEWRAVAADAGLREARRPPGVVRHPCPEGPFGWKEWDEASAAAYHCTVYAQIHLLKRRYRGGLCLCPAVAAPPQLAVEPRRDLRAAAAGLPPA
jgi:hypothetical protein